MDSVIGIDKAMLFRLSDQYASKNHAWHATFVTALYSKYPTQQKNECMEICEIQ